jgi:outer membrane protein assembly factor BamC
MRLHKNLLLLFFLLLNTACNYMPKLDEVIPDRRTEYKKSEAMPDLEVPPDLTVKSDTDPLVIPNEEATTLTQFENQKKMRHGGAGAVTGGQGDEQWLSLQGSIADIWPNLHEFLKAKGYTLDLDDQELGVIETQWHEEEQEGPASSRIKLSFFAEAGTVPDSTVIYLTSQKQEKVAGKDGKGDWVDIENNVDFEKQMIGELNLQFYGKQSPAGTSSIAKAADTAPPGDTSTGNNTSSNTSSKVKAEIQSLGDNKVFLSLPQEFNRAWSLTESAILDAGMFIDNKDRTKGLYFVTYGGQEGEQKKSGLFSKLKFWGKKKQESRAYQISLTGVGEKTELVVLNEKGDWVTQEEATRILTLLQGQYNNSAR